jgi:hypothetical protein
MLDIRGRTQAVDQHNSSIGCCRTHILSARLHQWLELGDARGKRNTPFLEFRPQPLAQGFALRGLKPEIADQATAIPFDVCPHAADDVLTLLQSQPP